MGLLFGTAGVIAWRLLAAETPPDAAGPAAVTPAGDARSLDTTPARAPAPGRTGPAAAPGIGTERAASSDAPALERASGDLIGDALRAYAVAELRRGWAEVRSDALPDDVLQRLLRDYEHQVRSLPATYGKQAAERATAVEHEANAFASADAVTLLEAIDGDEREAREFVAGSRFVSLFGHRGGGSAVDGTAYRSGDAIAEGATLTFPAGVFALGDLARGNQPFPAEVTVRGAAMDATLLVIDALGARSAVDRLAIEDCTHHRDRCRQTVGRRVSTARPRGAVPGVATEAAALTATARPAARAGAAAAEAARRKSRRPRRAAAAAPRRVGISGRRWAPP